MRVFACACSITVAVFAAPIQAQDFDPTLQILPFAEETRLIAEGRYDEAIDALTLRGMQIDAAVAGLEIKPNELSNDDPRISRWLTGFLNLNLTQHLYCHALAGRLHDPELVEICAEDWNIDHRLYWCLEELGPDFGKGSYKGCAVANGAAGPSWTPHFQRLAEALILEAEGNYEEAFQAYVDGRGMLRSLEAYEWKLADTRHEATLAATLIDDYIHYRGLRLRLVTSEKSRPKIGHWTNELRCPTNLPELCPGAVKTLKAMIEFANGFRLHADDLLANTLSQPQHWIGLDPYEHPLFWVAASAQRGDAPADVEHALSYRFELGETVAPDVRYVLDLYAGTADYSGAIPSVCDTPGCRYFLAQYLYGLDRVEDGNGVLRDSLAMCEREATLMCVIVRFGNAKIDAGGIP